VVFAACVISSSVAPAPFAMKQRLLVPERVDVDDAEMVPTLLSISPAQLSAELVNVADEAVYIDAVMPLLDDFDTKPNHTYRKVSPTALLTASVSVGSPIL